jgi:hypothetical protein
VAIPFQVYELTHSTLLVGLLGLVAFVPLLTVPLYAGAVADALDRRRLLLFSDFALVAVTAVLLANALLPDPRVWVLFVAEAAGTAAYGFQRPARNAMTPRLVPPEQLLAAIAVEDVVGNLARVAGPAAAGRLISTIGLAGVYTVDLASFVASIIAIWLLPPVRPGPRDRPSGPAIGPRGPALRPHAAGAARHLPGGHERDDLRHAQRALPGVRGGNRRRRGDGRAALLGPVRGRAGRLAGLGVGRTRAPAGTRGVRRGRALGVAIALFGFADAVWLALLMLAIAGAADFISAVLRSTIMLAATPDAMRGRISGIELAQVAGAPMLGNVEAGVVASLTSVRLSVVSGGVACVVGTVALALALPALLRYDSRKAGS